MSPKSIKKRLKEYWESCGDYWRTHAITQINRFDGKSIGIDSWIQQFGEIGYTNIGRKLASQLRVIRLSDLNFDPFSLQASDLFGQSQTHCYVSDDDDGGSWTEIQSILSHNQPQGTVFSAYFDKLSNKFEFPDQDTDEFVLYEDGLWSGSELVKRLRSISQNPPKSRIVFKFAIVSEFGLRVGRHAIRTLGLADRVSINTSSSELVRFMNDNVPADLQIGENYGIKDYFRALHGQTAPYAFRSGKDWTTEERQTCLEIGSQLVEQWVARESTTRPSDDDIEKFALGGGGFASTMIFARSVPKVCLPMLWLDGLVEIGTRKVHWKPLFVDARRIGNNELLCVK